MSVRRHQQQAREQFLARAEALPTVADQRRDLGFLRAVDLHQTACAQNLAFAVSGLRRTATSAISRT